MEVGHWTRRFWTFPLQIIEFEWLRDTISNLSIGRRDFIRKLQNTKKRETWIARFFWRSLLDGGAHHCVSNPITIEHRSKYLGFSWIDWVNDLLNAFHSTVRISRIKEISQQQNIQRAWIWVMGWLDKVEGPALGHEGDAVKKWKVVFFLLVKENERWLVFLGFWKKQKNVSDKDGG